MEKPQQETKAVIRLDKSRDYATVHGERRPNDPHHEVHFYQFGLPFSAHGELIVDHTEIAEDPRKQAAVEKLMKKAIKVKKEAPGDEVDKLLGDGGGDDGDEDNEPTLNLSMWARGEQKWPWQQVSDAIAARFSKRVTDKKGAVEILVEERVVSLGELSVELRKLAPAS